MPQFILTDPRNGNQYFIESDKVPTDEWMDEFKRDILGMDTRSTWEKVKAEARGVGAGIQISATETLGGVATTLGDVLSVIPQIDDKHVTSPSTWLRRAGRSLKGDAPMYREEAKAAGASDLSIAAGGLGHGLTLPLGAATIPKKAKAAWVIGTAALNAYGQSRNEKQLKYEAMLRKRYPRWNEERIADSAMLRSFSPSAISGFFEGATSGLGLGVWDDALPLFKKLGGGMEDIVKLRRAAEQGVYQAAKGGLARGAASEAIEESINEAIQVGIDKLSTDPHLTTRDAVERVGTAFFLGGALGGMFGGLTQASLNNRLRERAATIELTGTKENRLDARWEKEPTFEEQTFKDEAGEEFKLSDLLAKWDAMAEGRGIEPLTLSPVAAPRPSKIDAETRARVAGLKADERLGARMKAEEAEAKAADARSREIPLEPPPAEPIRRSGQRPVIHTPERFQPVKTPEVVAAPLPIAGVRSQADSPWPARRAVEEQDIANKAAEIRAQTVRPTDDTDTGIREGAIPVAYQDPPPARLKTSRRAKKDRAVGRKAKEAELKAANRELSSVRQAKAEALGVLDARIEEAEATLELARNTTPEMLRGGTKLVSKRTADRTRRQLRQGVLAAEMELVALRTERSKLKKQWDKTEKEASATREKLDKEVSVLSRARRVIKSWTPAGATQMGAFTWLPQSVADGALAVAIKAKQAGRSAKESLAQAEAYARAKAGKRMEFRRGITGRVKRGVKPEEVDTDTGSDFDSISFNAYMVDRLNAAHEYLLAGKSIEEAVYLSRNFDPMAFTAEELTAMVEQSRLENEDKGMGDDTPTYNISMWRPANYLMTVLGTRDNLAKFGRKSGNKYVKRLADAIGKHVTQRDIYGGKFSRMMFFEYNQAEESDRKAAAEEFFQYWKAKESNRDDSTSVSNDIYARSSELGKVLVDNWKQVAVETGKINKKNNVMVNQGGTWRPIGMLGEDFFPRIMLEKYRDAIKKGDTASMRELASLLYEKGLIKATDFDGQMREMEKKEYIAGWREKGAGTSFFGNLESARNPKLIWPSEIMDYSLDSVQSYISNWSERMAQIEAFDQSYTAKETSIDKKGKKTTKSKTYYDKFDKALYSLSKKSPLEKAEVELLAQYIEETKKAAMGEQMSSGELVSVVLGANKLATALFLTSGMSSLRNLTGIFSTITHLGLRPSILNLQVWGRTIKATKMAQGVAKMFRGQKSIKDYVEMKTLANDLEYTRELSAIKDDVGLLTTGTLDEAEFRRGPLGQKIDSALTKAVKGGLKWSLFSASERFVRTHAMITADVWRQHAIKEIKKNPYSKASEEAIRMFKRMDVKMVRNDSGFLVPEVVVEDSLNGEATKSFMIKMIKESQGGYTYDQLPLFMQKPTGKFMFKFWSWGMQQNRMFINNVLAEAKEGNITPFIRFIGSVLGSGALMYWQREFLLGKEKPHAGIKEIFKAAESGDAPWTSLFLDKVVNDAIYGGMMGLFTDIASVPRNFYKRTRQKDPLDPAGFQVLKNLGMAFMDIAETRSFQLPFSSASDEAYEAKSVQNAFEHFAKKTFSLVNYGSAFLQEHGVEVFDSAELHHAKGDVFFLRRATERFAEEYDIEKVVQWRPGRSVKTPASPYYNEIQEALLVGDSARATEVASSYIRTIAPADRRVKLRGLMQSVRMRMPMRIGTSTNEEMRADFDRWAKYRLTDEDYRRVRAVQDRYINTAKEAGLMTVGGGGETYRRMRQHFLTVPPY